MTWTTIIDGKALCYKNYRVRLVKKTARLKEETGVVPGLVVIVVEIIQLAKSM